MADKKKPVASDPLGILPSRLTVAETKARDAETKTIRAGLPAVELHADDLDKTIDQKWGDDEDYLTARDPMIDCVNRRKKDLGADAAGMSFKFFAPAVAGVIGMEDYRKSLDKDGNAYTVGEMWMGEIPTRIADKRRAKALKESEDAVAESAERYEDQVDRLKGQAKGLGLTVLAPGEMVTANAGSGHEDDYAGKSRAAGISVRRG